MIKKKIPVFEALREYKPHEPTSGGPFRQEYLDKFRNKLGRVSTPRERNRLQLGSPPISDRALDLIKNPYRRPRDPYRCLQNYNPYADKPNDYNPYADEADDGYNPFGEE